MKIFFQEAAFLLPHDDNRYATHKIVYDVCLGGEHRERRSFIFDVRQVESNGVQSLVVARATQFPTCVEATTQSVGLQNNQTLRASVCVPTYRRVGKKERYLNTPEEINPFFEELLARHGFKLNDIESVNKQSVHINRGEGTPFTFPACRFVFTATVKDLERACGAWVSGMGRGKGFGFGLLEVAAA